MTDTRSTPTLPARAPDTRPRVAALNMGPTDGIDSYQPYINLIKGTIANWSQKFYDERGEVRQLPPGRTIAMNVWYALTAPYQKIKAGRYVVKWTGGGATLTITCEGATIEPQLGRRRMCTLQQVSERSSGRFNIAFTNDTPAPIDISQLVVCHAEHEALLDAGEIFNPDYLEACGPRLAFIRTMKPMGIENSLVVEPAQLRSEAHQSWCASGDGLTLGMPYTVAAKLAARLGCNLNAPVPIRGSQALYDEIARQIASVAAFTGVIDAEVGNENWNDGYNSRQWLGSVFGPAQKPPLGAPQAEAHKALMWFKALAKHFPRQRIRRLYCGQIGGGFWSGSYFNQAMQHVDAAGVMQPGARFADLIDEVRVAPYTHPATSPAPDGSGFLNGRALKNIDWRTRTDEQLDALFANGQGAVEAWMKDFIPYIEKLRPGLPRSSYEWGQESSASASGYEGGAYLGTVSSRDNTFVWHASTPASFSDGDQWQFYSATSTFPSAGYANGARVFIKAKDATRAWFFASDAARLADTSNTGFGAITLSSPDPATRFVADNHTRAEAFGIRIKAYLDGPSGQAMYQRFFAATIGAGRLREACHLYDFAGYMQQYFVSMWGLKSSIYAADTPRFRWWRSL